MDRLSERAIDPPDDRPGCATCGEPLTDTNETLWIAHGILTCSQSGCGPLWIARNASDLTERLEALLELEDQPTLRIVARPFGTFITAFLGSLAGREDRGGLYYFEDLDGDKMEIRAENIDLLEVLG